MKILQIGLNQQVNKTCNNQISYKATFPVVHWVAEVNGSYAPIAQKRVVEQFQIKLIEFIKANLKKTYTDIQKLESKLNKKHISEKERINIKRKLKSLYELLDVPAQKLRAYLAGIDIDYRNKSTARSFYNVVSGSVDSPYATAYIITGENVSDFEKKFCKEFGKQRSLRKYRLEHGATEEEANTPEYKHALRKYNFDGFNYVNYYQRRIKDNRGETQTLHTKFVIERNTEGKFLGYKFIDARFLPEKGPNSPFTKMGIKFI